MSPITAIFFLLIIDWLIAVLRQLWKYLIQKYNLIFNVTSLIDNESSLIIFI
jgi:hypothetical protein